MEINRSSLFAGLLIGLGACGFLALGGLPGAIIFAFGLIGVVLSGTHLYTGRAGIMPLKETPVLVRIWLFNVLGCILLGLLAVLHTDILISGLTHGTLCAVP